MNKRRRRQRRLCTRTHVIEISSGNAVDVGDTAPAAAAAAAAATSHLVC